MPEPQNYTNHTRLDPLFHFVLSALLFALTVCAVILLIQGVTVANIAILLIAAALWIVGYKARTYALKVQDRLIRLEERLRLTTLLPDRLRARVPELTVEQLIALRFASDAEVAPLVDQTLAKRLTPNEIKQAVVEWRADYFRV